MPARCNSSAAKLGSGLVWRPAGGDGTIQGRGLTVFAMNRPPSQCSDADAVQWSSCPRPVRVRGDRKGNQHELHSMWPPMEASAKMRMRRVATLRESSGSTLPKSFPLLEETPMPMGWELPTFA